MSRVIDFTKYRVNRRTSGGCPNNTDSTISGSIHIHRRVDGSRFASLSGVYEDDYPYAIEALTDYASKLSAKLRLSRPGKN